MQPLAGITVLELGNFIAGPMAGMLLADMGASVIKIESVESGDLARAMPPHVDGHSATFIALNRNKRSLSIDLKSDAGRRAVLALAAKADAVIESFRPGVMDRLRLGPDDLRKHNPRLVYVAVSGFGQTGPMRETAGVNLIIEAAAGTLSVTDEPGQMPVRPGIQTADTLGALFTAYATLSALIGALRHRQGRTADVSLLETSLAAAPFETAEYLTTGNVPQAQGNRHRLTAPYQVFRTGCGRYIALGAPSNQAFAKICKALDVGDLLSDPRFSTYSKRKQSENELLPIIESAVGSRNASDVVDTLGRVGVPCALVRNYGEALSDDLAKARGLVVKARHRAIGAYSTMRNPVLFDQDSPTIRMGAPTLGQHTTEVLSEVGFSSEEIKNLQARGVVSCG